MMASGRSTTRHQDLGNNLTAGRSQGHTLSGSIDTKLATTLVVHTRRDRNKPVEAAGPVALHRPLAVLLRCRRLHPRRSRADQRPPLYHRPHEQMCSKIGLTATTVGHTAIMDARTPTMVVPVSASHSASNANQNIPILRFRDGFHPR
jgi:hypothetical protein